MLYVRCLRMTLFMLYVLRHGPRAALRVSTFRNAISTIPLARSTCAGPPCHGLNSTTPNSIKEAHTDACHATQIKFRRSQQTTPHCSIQGTARWIDPFSKAWARVESRKRFPVLVHITSRFEIFGSVTDGSLPRTHYRRMVEGRHGILSIPSACPVARLMSRAQGMPSGTHDCGIYLCGSLFGAV